MKYLKSIKTMLVLLLTFVLSLVIILLDKTKYTTISDIKVHTYTLFAVMMLSFYGFFAIIHLRSSKNISKTITKTDKIVNVVHIVLIIIGILATGFGIMLTGAYIKPIAGNSIEDTQRYIEQYQIILLGMRIFIYAQLSFIITTCSRLFYFWIKEKFIKDKISNDN